VVVCGDGACGAFLLYHCGFKRELSAFLSRQNIIAERLYEGLLYTSLVRHLVFHIDNFLIACPPSEPTVFENYVHDIYVDDQLVELSLWDTAGALVKNSARYARC
jgi:GTPase SAR1 family protein